MQSALFLSHGAPQIVLDDSAAHNFLKELGGRLEKPASIVVISAHWESAGLKIGGAEKPRTIYDFGGFDPKLYEMTYPVSGNVELARLIAEKCQQSGIPSLIDPSRGLDHGAWVPLHLMYPQADIPVLQVSVPREAAPSEMYALGQVLGGLREQNVLILGSGSLTHNLYEFRGQDLDEAPPQWVSAFSDWVSSTLDAGDVQALLDYREKAPFARENHPTEEHILPFFAVLGAAAGQKLERLHHSYNYGILAMDAYGVSLPARP